MVRAVLLVSIAWAGACASAGAPSSRGDRGDDRDVLTRAQLEEVSYLNAQDAVQRLKPIWLRTERGQDSFITQGRRGLRIYVDGIYYGEKESLRTLQVQTIEEIRYLDKREATRRFGTDHSEGALLILTRRR